MTGWIEQKTWWSRLAAWLWPRRDQAPAPTPEEVRRNLTRMMQIFAESQDTGQCFRLMTEAMGLTSLAFYTTVPLVTGERLDLSMLLWSDTRICLKGRVQYALRSERGYRGELSLEADPKAQETLACYLHWACSTKG